MELLKLNKMKKYSETLRDETNNRLSFTQKSEIGDLKNKLLCEARMGKCSMIFTGLSDTARGGFTRRVSELNM